MTSNTWHELVEVQVNFYPVGCEVSIGELERGTPTRDSWDMGEFTEEWPAGCTDDTVLK
jgi:hypothetical protein